MVLLQQTVSMYDIDENVTHELFDALVNCKKQLKNYSNNIDSLLKTFPSICFDINFYLPSFAIRNKYKENYKFLLIKFNFRVGG